MIRNAFLSTAIVLVTVAIARAELIDNPQYVAWAKHKAGTKVEMSAQTAMQGMTMSQTLTQTMLELSPEKAVVETAVVMDMGGMKHESKQKMDVPAKVEKGTENLPPGTKGTFKEVGTEKVSVGDKSYDCKVYEFSGEGEQGKSSGKVWMTDQIPGGTAKSEVKMEAPQQATMSMKVTKIESK
jgi:hypothetical protein